MFSKTKIALSAAIVLSTAFAASAATKSQVTQASGAAFYTMIPSYDRNGGGSLAMCRRIVAPSCDRSSTASGEACGSCHIGTSSAAGSSSE